MFPNIDAHRGPDNRSCPRGMSHSTADLAKNVRHLGAGSDTIQVCFHAHMLYISREEHPRESSKGRQDPMMIRKSVQDRRLFLPQAVQLILGLFNQKLQRFDVGYNIRYLSIDILQFSR